MQTTNQQTTDNQTTYRTSMQMENNNTQSTWQKFKEWRFTNVNFYFYLIFVIICSIICVIIQSLSYWSFCKTKNDILRIYKPNTTIETKIERDSVFYREIDGLLSPFCNNVIQKNYLHNIVDKSVAYAIKQIDADSLAKRKIETIQQDTKTLLDLQYHKIEHEFQIMQVWCGILTVIFLIFSFYSLFKTDDLVKQGKEGLARLDHIEERGEEKINGFHKKCNEALQAFSNRSNGKLQEFDIKTQHRINTIKTALRESQEAVKVYVDNVKKDINNYQNSVIEKCNDILERDSRQNENIRNAFNKSDVEVSMLRQQLNTIESRLKTIEEHLTQLTRKN